MDGFLLIDKPAGWTSFDIVNKIRRTSGVKKVGHAGTLDPFATGLVIVLLGSYTKQQSDFMKRDKTYLVEATLGQKSSTGDPEGDISPVSSVEPSRPKIEDALTAFTGDIKQVPPAHSAIKVNGQRAYKLARQGKEVVLEPRQVTIHRISLLAYSYPLLRFETAVSSGTYIRTLVADIGAALDTGAYTSSLRRTQIDSWSVDQAVSPEAITTEAISQAIHH